uniref:Ig-like domain-containing protein n=1 Tax=Neolamprologus brichardi TaxID=32507 RepID=A0A3Q4G7J4_NEOBR
KHLKGFFFFTTHWFIFFRLNADDVSLPVVADTEVSCIFMESCMLPCSYSGSDVVIHWFQVSAGDLNVHSFYNNQDQLKLQSERFRGRTSLFNDQISAGIASLQLTKVEVQDEGRYNYEGADQKNTIFFSFLEAPVHKVDVYQGENGITCRSEGIYPKPELTWSTSPPSSLTFKNTTTVNQTEQQLYNISSSLILSGSDHDLNFSCTVSTRRNRKSVAFLKMLTVIIAAAVAFIIYTYKKGKQFHFTSLKFILKFY